MFCRTLVMATALFAVLAAAPPDPILGTWKLNLSKSKFNPGPAPRSQTRTYIQTPEGVQVTINTIGANGRAAKPIEFPDRYDGRDYPINGSEFADAIARADPAITWPKATMKHAGRTVAVARQIITDEGKTLIISYSEPNAQPPVNNELVYDKQ